MWDPKTGIQAVLATASQIHTICRWQKKVALEQSRAEQHEDPAHDPPHLLRILDVLAKLLVTARPFFRPNSSPNM
jgi:hypothetical protein